MPQGRRSRLIIRRVDPWTILKFSVLLYLSMYFVILVAGVVLWTVASATGVRGNVEGFIGQLIASDHFKFEAGQIFKSSVVGGAVLVVVGSVANVLMAVLFNLISDVAGGIGISVEERPVQRRRARSRSRRAERDTRREESRESAARGQRRPADRAAGNQLPPAPQPVEPVPPGRPPFGRPT
jgi:hypothetical protein